MYAYIENGEIKRFGNLPKVWTLNDGSTVSGFHLFADRNIEDEEGTILKTGAELLREEGWLPVEDVIPTYDETTEFLTNPQYEILADKVIRRYSVGIIPIVEEVPQEPSEIELLQEKVAIQETVIEELMFIIIPELTGGGI